MSWSDKREGPLAGRNFLQENKQNVHYFETNGRVASAALAQKAPRWRPVALHYPEKLRPHGEAARRGRAPRPAYETEKARCGLAYPYGFTAAQPDLKKNCRCGKQTQTEEPRQSAGAQVKLPQSPPPTPPPASPPVKAKTKANDKPLPNDVKRAQRKEPTQTVVSKQKSKAAVAAEPKQKQQQQQGGGGGGGCGGGDGIANTAEAPLSARSNASAMSSKSHASIKSTASNASKCTLKSQASCKSSASNKSTGTIKSHVSHQSQRSSAANKAAAPTLSQLQADRSGFFQLSDSERQAALNEAHYKYEQLIGEYNRLPVSEPTLRVRNRKIDIERELDELDYAINMFDRPNLYYKRC